MTEKHPSYGDVTPEEMARLLEQIQQQLDAGHARLSAQRAQSLALLRELKLARAAENDRAWELADVEQRLRDLAERREGPGDPLIEREIAQLTRRRTKLEEDVLAHLLLVDALVARAQAEEQALAAAQQEWAAREASLIAEHDRIVLAIGTAEQQSS